MGNFNEKSKIAYNRKADNYESTSDGKFTRKFKQLLLSEIELRGNDIVLDVACGNGSLLSALNAKKPINGYGIDISDRMIENAAVNNPNMKFCTAECENIPLEDGSVDIITVCAAYHHFPNPTAFAKEASRVLKPNGKIYIAEIYLPSILRLLINPFVPLSSEGDVKFYSPKEISLTFEKNGFRQQAVKKFGYVQIVFMQRYL